MKKTLLKLAALSTLGFASSQVFAAGSLCALPAAPTGSAYINAYNDGRVIPPLAGPPTSILLARMNFGSTADGGSAGVCQITGLANDTVTPVAGYTLIASVNRLLPTVTGGTTQAGTVFDRIWRKPAATAPATATDMCIFGTEVSNLADVDNDDATAGTQYLEVNDIARGGFSASGTLNVGYLKFSTYSTYLYRVGRTFTSVQHRPYIYGSGTLAQQQNNASGHLDLPTIGGSTTLNISIMPQQAAVNSNWVNFTTYAVYANPVGGFVGVSVMTYVQASCDSSAPSSWVKADAIRIRQTGQHGQPLKEISISGYAPPGAVIP